MIAKAPNETPNAPKGEWVTTDNNEDTDYNEAQRRCFRSDEGTIYLPSSPFMEPQAAFFCAAFDGLATIIDTESDEVYLPVSFFIKQYPEAKEKLESLVEKVRKAT